MPTAEELISVASIERLAAILRDVAPRESDWAAVRASAAALGPLGLSDRARTVRDALLRDLPGGHARLAAVVRAALERPDLTGWMVWPVTEAVAATATDDAAYLADGLDLLAALTPRLTGEFALRTFLIADLDRTLATALSWTGHPDAAVRRLASEGTRPRLPWARQVPALNARPAVTVPILDRLYRDPSEVVRRSVANHLNDVSRLDPRTAVATASAWAGDAAPALIRHAMRTLVKQGDRAALALVGFRGEPEALAVTGPTVRTPRVLLGGDLVFEARITNVSREPVTLAIDYVINHRKAGGRSAPRVFKLAKRTLEAGESHNVVRRHSFRPITTRRYHSGPHSVELQVNGARFGQGGFVLDTASPE
jgi:3-methyladenine DNA glycosylase AlkC